MKIVLSFLFIGFLSIASFWEYKTEKDLKNFKACVTINDTTYLNQRYTLSRCGNEDEDILFVFTPVK